MFEQQCEQTPSPDSSHGPLIENPLSWARRGGPGKLSCDHHTSRPAREGGGQDVLGIELELFEDFSGGVDPLRQNKGNKT